MHHTVQTIPTPKIYIHSHFKPKLNQNILADLPNARLPFTDTLGAVDTPGAVGTPGSVETLGSSAQCYTDYCIVHKLIQVWH